MLNIYAWSYNQVYIVMLVLLVIWRVLARVIRADIWKILNGIGAVVAVFLILRFTVLGRTPSDQHQFMIMADYKDEFYREMLMNVFLYFPLGLTLGELIGWKVVLVAFALAFGVEVWQYVAGTGNAQATDVLCNTFGALIGTVFWLWRRKEKNG